MNMKITKPIALLLSALLLLSLAACSPKESDEGMTTTEAGTTEERATAPLTVIDTETTAETTAETTVAETTSAETTAAETTVADTTNEQTAPSTPSVAPTTPQTEAPQQSAAGSFSSGDLSVSVNGVRMRPNTAWSSYSAALGEPSSVTQAPSCHFDGMDNIYDYSDFSVYTYRDGGEDYVYDIEIFSSAIPTDKGIRVGSSAEDVVAAYGDGYANYSDSMIEYRSGSQSLYFTLNGGTVTLIEFYSE